MRVEAQWTRPTASLPREKMERHGPRLRTHRSARLRTAAAGCRAGGELRVPGELLTTCRTAITEIGAQGAVAPGELRIARHQARTGLTHGDAIEQQPNVAASAYAPLVRDNT